MIKIPVPQSHAFDSMFYGNTIRYVAGIKRRRYPLEILTLFEDEIDQGLLIYLVSENKVSISDIKSFVNYFNLTTTSQ